MEPSNTHRGGGDAQGGRGVTAQKDAKPGETGHVYAQINREIEMILSDDDKIVFGPSEDFEYTAPLEDFRRSQQWRPAE